MIMTTPVSCKATLITNKGQDSEGHLVKGKVNIGGLRAGVNDTKLYNVASLLCACVAHQVLTIVKTESVELTEE